MIFPSVYKVMNQSLFSKEEYSIVPIRYEDRFKIMEWRNEQIYHLRQSELLTSENQDNYFTNVVLKLFEKEKPDQLLFSYLKNGECIGYGGLVHINWIDKNAEISFIMKTELEKKEFKKHWGIYLDLIEQVAFKELGLHKLFTYAFDLRPHLYAAIELKGYVKESILKDHCLFEGTFKDVIIHSKINYILSIREVIEDDTSIILKWANDPVVRNNSFNSELIEFEQHSKWLASKIKDETAFYFICEVDYVSAGLVRFDFDGEKYIIGLIVSKEYRGKRFASRFLDIACEELRKVRSNRIVAYIKEENIASQKAFEKIGFKLFSKELIQGNKSLKYEYTR